MKLLTFDREGALHVGAATERGVADLTPALGARHPDLKSLLADPAGLDAARAALAATAAGDWLPLQGLRFAPLIPDPGKIICVGLNYHAHRIETGREETEQPTLFLRLPGAQVGHGQALLRPRESKRFDYEGEIAVVIGRGGRRIAAADAWGHVAGYSCFNDGSVRDFQRHTSQFTAGKNFDRSGAFGPWLVTADEIAPGSVLTLVTRLNGQEVQRTTTDLMIHPIPRLIAYVSTFTALAPGDVIVTGTPGGVGDKRSPPLYMRAGDTIEVEVDRIGTLRNAVADD